MTCRAVVVVLCLQAATVVATAAQGLTLAPSFGTSAVYDDNLFQQPHAEGDLSVRFSPRLDAVRTTGKLTVSSRFALDAERFAQHPELTTARAREDAAVDARYAASRRLSIAGAASFTDTQTPADLNEITALTPGRAQARRVTVHPSVTYSLGPSADASVGYTMTSDTLHGGVSVSTQTASSSLERRVSARTGVRIEYLEQRVVFGGSQAIGSHAFTAEWTRALNRGATLALRAGPRMTGGVFAPELAATARLLQRAGNLSLSYQRTQTTLIGLGGIADVNGVTVTAERELWPRVRLTASSGVLRTRQPEGTSLSYRLGGKCTWSLARGLAVEAGYDADRQRGNPYADQPAQNIRRNRAMVTLVVAPSSAAPSSAAGNAR
jgi:hypothetical protein